MEHESGSFDVEAGQAIVTSKGEWVRYSTPGAEGAEYVAVCVPGFTPDAAHRDEGEQPVAERPKESKFEI